jgi:hypothetical protein
MVIKGRKKCKHDAQMLCLKTKKKGYNDYFSKLNIAMATLMAN